MMRTLTSICRALFSFWRCCSVPATFPSEIVHWQLHYHRRTIIGHRFCWASVVRVVCRAFLDARPIDCWTCCRWNTASVDGQVKNFSDFVKGIWVKWFVVCRSIFGSSERVQNFASFSLYRVLWTYHFLHRHHGLIVAFWKAKTNS